MPIGAQPELLEQFHSCVVFSEHFLIFTFALFCSLWQQGRPRVRGLEVRDVAGAEGKEGQRLGVTAQKLGERRIT